MAVKNENAEVEFDMAGAIETLGEELGFGEEAEKTEKVEATPETPIEQPADAPVEPTEPEEAPAEPAETSAASTTPAPKTWRAEALSEWEKLPPTVKAEVLKREEDMFRGIEEYKGRAQVGDTYKAITEQYVPLLTEQNLKPEEAVNNLLSAHALLSKGSPQQKADILIRISRDYGIDLGGVAQYASTQPALAPEVMQLQQEINQLKSQTSTFEARARQQTEAQLNAQIEEFAQNPANVHFNAVANDMIQLLNGGVSTTLEDAYAKAVWMNPAIRNVEQARLNGEAQARAAKESAERTAAAQKAASANVKTTAKKGSPAAPLGTMDETLKETMAEIKNRG